jgi:2-keto-3-deoxy-L-rhamnonate aldolase RhmA
MLDGQLSLKKRMLGGVTVYGAFFKSHSAISAEPRGNSGFDHVHIDGEHSDYGYRDMQEKVRGANGVGPHAADMGAQGVQMPNPRTLEEADCCAKAMRLLPFCGTYEDAARSIGWGAMHIASSSEIGMPDKAFRDVIGTLRKLGR